MNTGIPGDGLRGFKVLVCTIVKLDGKFPVHDEGMISIANFFGSLTQ